MRDIKISRLPNHTLLSVVIASTVGLIPLTTYSSDITQVDATHFAPSDVGPDDAVIIVDDWEPPTDPKPDQVKHPFPQQHNFKTLIKPSQHNQDVLNQQIKSYFEQWQKSYLKASNGNTPGGGYYVAMKGTGGNGNEITTSEAHGYGMLILVLMADAKNTTQDKFDGMYNMYDKHRSKGNSHLMSWVIDKSESPDKDSNSATDGDLDIAYALLLADKQWGSKGKVNYLKEAKRIIQQGILKSNLNAQSKRLMLGDWDTNQWSTRSSDWMIGHLRAFYQATKDESWNQAIDTIFNVSTEIQQTYSKSTGLMPDFIVGESAKPAPPDFLEGETDDDFSWNACRFPLRIAIDATHHNHEASRKLLKPIVNWITNTTDSNPSSIMAGYTLDGTPLVGYSSMAFTAPMIAAAAAMGDTQYQSFIDKGWDLMRKSKDSYYSDTINLLAMLFISGNWWTPAEAKHQQPVFKEDFESSSANPLNLELSDAITIKDNCEENHGKCLRISYQPNEQGSPRITSRYKLPAAKAYTLNYDVYFEPGFEFVKGGKLPGLGPIQHITGCKAGHPEGWSARLMWARDGQLRSYYYPQQRQQRCGESKMADSFQFTSGKWYSVSLYVNVGENDNNQQGKIEVYINGKKLIENNSITLRDSLTSNSEINQLLFSTFFGGNDKSWAPSKTVYSRFDNFSVYKGKYIPSAK
ncbi:glycosyl hydrolase family 8 [Zooshikella ganghwensis]|uniref:Glucanase n=1 Tax=Zooshikella ganghwensis TaxID=202772 RepID=A0A4P9VKG2_9GAMM|nr:glycosyl hydrolase family 8 [Zooshikella ganghwensis]RDH42302.1 hypothetical protein B9G39_01940 [Zooshikella ganghwensis]